jgi:hypothetical protein
MGIKYTEEQRIEIMKNMKGKTIEMILWDEEGQYWVMSFTDGQETCLRFMAELF